MSSGGSLEAGGSLRLFLACCFPTASPSRLDDGAGATSTGAGRSRASTSRWPSSARARALSSRRSSRRCARPRRLLGRSRSSPSATARPAPSGCSFSTTPRVRPHGSRSTCRSAWKPSASTSERRVHGFHTSPCFDFGSVRGSNRRSLRSGPRSSRSLRPGRLLSFHACTRQGHGTRFSNSAR